MYSEWRMFIASKHCYIFIYQNTHNQASLRKVNKKSTCINIHVEVINTNNQMLMHFDKSDFCNKLQPNNFNTN